MNLKLTIQIDYLTEIDALLKKINEITDSYPNANIDVHIEVGKRF
jgi:hypothetical protein